MGASTTKGTALGSHVRFSLSHTLKSESDTDIPRRSYLTADFLSHLYVYLPAFCASCAPTRIQRMDTSWWKRVVQ